MQNTRSTTVSNVQDNCNNCSNNWDSGNAAGAFVAGAIVAGTAAAAGAAMSAPPPTAAGAPPPATVPPPCNVAPVAVNGVPYYQCGATWYTAGYGSAGVVYMPVPPPAGS